MGCFGNIQKASITVRAVLFLLFAHGWAACTHENPFDRPENDPVRIVFAPLAAGVGLPDPNDTGTAADDKVTEMRIMAFNSTDGVLALNELFDLNANFQNPVMFSLEPETYDFIFIANEKSDPVLSSALDAMIPGTAVWNELENASFAATAFDADRNIPMSGAYYNVIVSKDDNGVSLDGGITFLPATQTNPWEVEIDRLAVRLNVVLKTELASIAANFSQMEFARIPDRVYVLPAKKDGTPVYNNTGSNYAAPRALGVADGDSGYTGGMTLNNGVWEWKKFRMILPSSTFSAATDPDLGVLMTVSYTHTDLPDRTAVLGPVDNSYNLPRNHYLTLTGTLYQSFDIELGVRDWKIGLDEETGTSPVYLLTLSQTSIDMKLVSGDLIVRITTTYPGGWTAEVSKSFTAIEPNNDITITPAQGPQGATDMLIKQVQNSPDARNVYIYVKAGNMTAIINIQLIGAA